MGIPKHHKYYWPWKWSQKIAQKIYFSFRKNRISNQNSIFFSSKIRFFSQNFFDKIRFIFPFVSPRLNFFSKRRFVSVKLYFFSQNSIFFDKIQFFSTKLESFAKLRFLAKLRFFGQTSIFCLKNRFLRQN